MSTAPLATADSEQLIKNGLKRDFPGWRIVVSDRGRWWAFRGPLPANRMNAVDTVEADTPDGLRAQLADIAAKAAQ